MLFVHPVYIINSYKKILYIHIDNFPFSPQVWGSLRSPQLYSLASDLSAKGKKNCSICSISLLKSSLSDTMHGLRTCSRANTCCDISREPKYNWSVVSGRCGSLITEVRFSVYTEVDRLHHPATKHFSLERRVHASKNLHNHQKRSQLRKSIPTQKNVCMQKNVQNRS